MCLLENHQQPSDQSNGKHVMTDLYRYTESACFWSHVQIVSQIQTFDMY